MNLIIFLLVSILIGIIMFLAGKSLARSEFEAESVKSKQTAQDIIENGRKQAETLKKEALLEAKEENQKYHEKIENELKERRAELKQQEERLAQREENLNRKDSLLEQYESSLNNKEYQLDSRQHDIDENEKRVQELVDTQVAKLEQLADLSKEEARNIVLEKAKEDVKHERAVMIREMNQHIEEEADTVAKDVIATAIQRSVADQVSETTVSVVHLPNDDMKGRIIGREGRNIRTLETLTGIDFIIDDTPEAVVLSGFDPVRREIACIALENLIKDGRIHPARIEEMVDKARKEVDVRIRHYGEEAIFELGIHSMHPDLIKILGRLHFRTSYGQNALDHSIEVAKMAGIMASELGEDELLAKRAGLLHDIGKAIDHEVSASHVEIGIELAEKYHENEVVVNSIASHHGDTEATSIISVLVASADTLSAARPGARSESLENYIRRLERLEEISNNFPGVKSSFAIQAGRELRIMVEPDIVSDDDITLLTHDIKDAIENELEYPGHIKVIVIRETRAVEYAR